MTYSTVLHAGGPVATAAGHTAANHITFLEAGVVGLLQGVTELFPVSSLGHNVLIPAVIGGSWARDLNVAKPDSPYLAFIVGLHVATAIALIIYFWRDWLRIIGGFFSSLKHFAAPPAGEGRWRLTTVDQRMAWMIILATVPVGVAGLLFEKQFRVVFGKPLVAGVFLTVNGLILYAGEKFRRQSSIQADEWVAAQRELVPAGADGAVAPVRAGGGRAGGARSGGGRHRQVPTSGYQAARSAEVAEAEAADRRLATLRYGEAVIIGASQVLALMAGISRDGVTMVTGMFRGLSRQDAVRFAFLLATPAILAAGLLEVPKLMGPLGNGIRGQTLFGSVLAGLGAYVSVRFLTSYFAKTRTLTPFAVYCFAAGLASVAYLGLVK